MAVAWACAFGLSSKGFTLYKNSPTKGLKNPQDQETTAFTIAYNKKPSCQSQTLWYISRRRAEIHSHFAEHFKLLHDISNSRDKNRELLVQIVVQL
jgi:hypothetical protein